MHTLLAAQHPDLTHLPLHLVDAGWDNVIFRLGDQLCVRLPRRKMAATLIEQEQTWLPQLPKLPLPIPYRLDQFSKFGLQILVGTYGRTPLQAVICRVIFWN